MSLSTHPRNSRKTEPRPWNFAATACVAMLCWAATLQSSMAGAPASTVVPSDPEQRTRQYQRAEALYLSGHLKEASAAFEELSRAYPNDAHVWLKYGNALTKLGNYGSAADAFQNAAALDPSQGNSSLNLGLVRLAQAREALEGAKLRLAPDSAEHMQAAALLQQIKILLGEPEGPLSH